MTALLKQALEEVEKLPTDQQDQYARFLLHELATDADWERTTVKYADSVQRLTDEVLAAHHRGDTEELDPEKL